MVSLSNRSKYGIHNHYAPRPQRSYLSTFLNSVQSEDAFTLGKGSPPTVHAVSSSDDSSSGEPMETSWTTVTLSDDQSCSKSTLASDLTDNSVDSCYTPPYQRRIKKKVGRPTRSSAVAITWDSQSTLNKNSNARYQSKCDDNYYKKMVRDNNVSYSSCSRPNDFLPLRSPVHSPKHHRTYSEENPISDRSITSEFTSMSIASDYGARAYHRPDDWVGGSSAHGKAKRSWRPKGSSRR